MTLQNSYLNTVARLLAENNEIDLSGYSNQKSNVIPADDTLTNEIGSREDVTITRAGTTLNYNTTRSSANVVDAQNGDDIKEIGLFLTNSNDDLQVYTDVANIVQTTDFDIETTVQVNVERAS